MNTRISFNACLGLDSMGAQTGQGLPMPSVEVQSTLNNTTPSLIRTLETSRPDRYRKWRQESKEVRDTSPKLITSWAPC
jgi:hypothetical protein